MRKLRSRLLGVESGSIMLFSDYQHDGVMWTGEGPREFRKVIKFDEAFSSIPVVQVGMSLWDFDKATNQRADIFAEMINPEGFALVFRTWGDTRIARARADWIAFGEATDDDDWVLE